MGSEMCIRDSINILYKKKEKHPSDYNVQKFKEEKCAFARNCRRARNKNWNEFLDSTSNVDEINKLGKIFAGKQTITMGSLLKPNGAPAEPGIETLETLLRTHYPSGEPLQKNRIP